LTGRSARGAARRTEITEVQEYPYGVEAVDEHVPLRVPEVARVRLEHVYHRGSCCREDVIGDRDSEGISACGQPIPPDKQFPRARAVR
jgi:hypothetical protein